MFNKIYDNFKQILKEEYKSIIFIVLFTIIMTIKVPYYIITGGGITNLGNRFSIDNSYSEKGSYNLSYVSQTDGRVLTYLLSFVVPSWDRESINDYKINNSEDEKDIELRDKLSLEKANQTAVYIAYKEAGQTFNIKKNNLYVIYVDENIESDKKIKVGDIINTVDGNNISTFDEFKNYVLQKNVGDYITIKVIRNKKEETVNVKIREENGSKIAGLSFWNIYDYDTNPKISFNFKSVEQGSSAGFMTSLAIYDRLIEDDLTSGLKIAGTGTISEDGEVGEISGIKYKLQGASNSGANIFFAPSGSNYLECIKIKEEKGYDIEVVEVDTIYSAINYLKELKKEKNN